MPNFKWATRTAVLAAVAIVGAGVISTPASAANNIVYFGGNGSTATCDGYMLCVYPNTSYKGSAIGSRNGASEDDMRDYYINDSISSIINNSGNAYCFYSDTFYKGLTFQIHAGEKWPAVNGYINDKISSWKVGNC
ncbi:peptidase inhibitor family I36 protein [[Kitasatospora] papulosa]|uniref:peptidase inhibitor family I36 protein n=1 Tax=[Kitasatospora] papulosa TaxID=1464011 RepID=UPI003678E9BA